MSSIGAPEGASVQPPQSPEAPTGGRPASSRAHVIGAAVVGGGIALMVCRFGLMPFGRGTSTISLVIGLATGLIVAGLFQMRNARPKAPLANQALAFLFGGALSAGAFFFVYPPLPSVADLALEPRQLPGLDALLPAQEASQQEVAAASGLIKIERPADLPGAISLEWQPGDAWEQPEVDLVARTLKETLDPAAAVTSSRLTVAGQDGFGITFSSDRMEMRGALWTCPDDGRLFTLWCGFSAEPAQVQALFDKMLAGLACTEPPPQVRGQSAALSSLPSIGTPGFGLVESSGYVQLGNLDGEILLIQHNRSGKLGKLLTDKPELLEHILGGMAGQEGMRLDFDRTPRTIQATDGRTRPLWLIDATAGDERVFMAVSVLDCEESRSYLLMVLRSGGDRSTEQTAAEKILAAIGCPGPNQAPPPKFEQMAQAACEAGDARGCFQLADLYQTADPDDARASGLLEKACRLGLPEACPAPGAQP